MLIMVRDPDSNTNTDTDSLTLTLSMIVMPTTIHTLQEVHEDGCSIGVEDERSLPLEDNMICMAYTPPVYAEDERSLPLEVTVPTICMHGLYPPCI